MKFSQHHASKFVKVMYIGDSSTGKTGSLVSLVQAGYKLRVLDLDNGLDILRAYVHEECPELVDNIDYETLRDPIKASASGPRVSAKAFVEATKLMTTWSDGADPGKAGPEWVFVLDSTTSLGKSAFEWAKSLAPAAKDPRQWFYAAQQAFENIIGLLTGEEFECNVVVIGHVNYKELQDGTTKGYPSAVGSALGPTIPKYFNTLVMAETMGSGKSLRRVIRTIPTSIIDLKTPAPFLIEDTYDLGTGLAEIFRKLTTLE